MGLADVAANKSSGGVFGQIHSGATQAIKNMTSNAKKSAKKKPYSPPAPAPTPYSPPPSTTSSGSYSGGGGAPSNPPSVSQGPIGGVGRSGPSQAQRRQRAMERRQAAREKKQERRKEYQNFMSEDETLQDALINLKQQMGDYREQNKGSRQEVREDFRTAKQRMGQERERSLEQMMEDFAARGMLQSSEYLDSVGDYNTEYQQRLGDLSQDRTRNIQDLLESLGMFRTEVKGRRQNAREEALQRRAQKYSEFA